ncbi:5'-methylthioadenosine/adenosylhomocysteine nucleosidase [Facilibium subflavum]|uniref:5'-methylthioadenosine/adenosylhomocysteine nucleosidase n=1 Tax=Facilibium subflavum TaxID=2219058 RepID=UPI000E65D189|nr:5'-methylthioadenosine/adenosylhomocysteine nucleosidase [Facilibium subflavum]
MKIAVLGAMAEEIAPILAQVGDYGVIEYANNKYYQADYAGHTLIIAHSKIGKVFSALTASAMIQHFGAQVLLFSGVAGGVRDDINVGDLTMATKTVQHDVDICAFGYALGQVPGSLVEIKTDENLCQLAERVADQLQIPLKKGLIATGDQFIHHLDKKIQIQQNFDAIALEMEGGSVNLVCHEMGVPCLILRAISDTADGQAVDDFPKFVQQASNRSAAFLLQLIKQY